MQLMALLTFFLLGIQTMACPEIDLTNLKCELSTGRNYTIDYISLKENKLAFKVLGIETAYELPMNEEIDGVRRRHFCSEGEIKTDEHFQGNFTRSTMFVESGSLRILGQEIITDCNGRGEERTCLFSGFRTIDINCIPSL